jgi:TPR repeat protein
MDLASLKTAAAAGNNDANFQLGQCLSLGTLGATHNHAEAAKLFAAAAAAGHIDAMGALAQCLLAGDGVKQDVAAGAKWAKNSADAGSAFGFATYGLCLRLGYGGVTKDEKAGLALLRKAADAGVPGGINSLGICYERGQGVQKDLKMAFQLY